MIVGAHVIIASTDAASDRAFFRDVLGFRSVDAGEGWLIFALPPAELAVHPADAGGRDELYLMCDDVQAEIRALGERGIRCSPVQQAGWGAVTKIPLPGGGSVGLYEPHHPTTLTWGPSAPPPPPPPPSPPPSRPRTSRGRRPDAA